MLIKQKLASDVRPSEITPQTLFKARRQFLRTAVISGLGFAAGSIAPPAFALASRQSTEPELPDLPELQGVVESPWSLKTLGEEATPYKSIVTYNNFYEFGNGKGQPAKYSSEFKTTPWTIEVDGQVEKPGTYSFEDIVNPHKLEERVYRFRCVEAWSMVIPWVGVPLADVIKRLGPTGNAKCVAFETLYDPDQMPGQLTSSVDWPYREGLRMDEAMNPLTLLAVGVYGKVIPNQNGAPIRLVVPWKYGYKSIKSIVRMSFVEDEPPTTWNLSQPSEYGFYSNVNPEVDHPRWSQARERRIGDFMKRPTLMFNGYAEEVASLYQGMDLAKNF